MDINLKDFGQADLLIDMDVQGDCDRARKISGDTVMRVTVKKTDSRGKVTKKIAWISIVADQNDRLSIRVDNNDTNKHASLKL